MKHKRKVLAVSLAVLLLVSTAVQFTAFGEELQFDAGTQETAEAQADEGNTTASEDAQTDAAAVPEGGENSNLQSGGVSLRM